MVTEMQKIEPFLLTDQEPIGLTAYDGHPGEAGADWADVWKFQLPAGYTYVFDRDDTLSVYLEYLAEDLDHFYTDDGGTLVDDTTDMNDADADDVQPYPATQAANDAIYFGQRYRFVGIRVVIGTAGTGLVWDEQWEYYDGSAWVTFTGLSASATSIFTDAAGNVEVTWNYPADWAKTTVNGHNAYWARCRLHAVTTQATVDPLITSGQVHGYATPEIKAAEQVRLVYRDPNEENNWRLMGAVRYASIREFQQASKMHHLDIAGQILVPENYWIVIQARNTAGIIDASNGYFSVRTKRSRFSVAPR